MRITLLNQFYPPAFAPTGYLTQALAEHLAQSGDHVTVLSSRGGYVAGAPEAEPNRSGNPHVFRIWTPRFGKRHMLGRLLDYASFFFGSLLRLSALPRQDLIISLTTPPFIAWAAVPHILLHPTASLVLWNMDCYPEIAERTGAIKAGGLASRILRWINQRLFNRLAGAVCLDHAMHSLLIRGYTFDRERTKLAVLPAWEQKHRFLPELETLSWSEIGIDEPRHPFVVLYMGNAGRGHEFSSTLEVIDDLRDEPISFIFVGGGSAWDPLQRDCANRALKDVRFYPYVPHSYVPSILARASCGLVTMRNEALGTISPSKIYAYLAMSLPLLYLGPQGSNVDDAITRFGVGISLRHSLAACGATFLKELANDSARLAQLRTRSRQAFEEAYSDVRVLPQFDTFIKSVIGPSQTTS